MVIRGGQERCVCELVGLLYAVCRRHGKLVRWARAQRKHQVGSLRHHFKGTPIGVRYLSSDEIVRLADQLVEREARIQTREGRHMPKRCDV
jgi:hypothetical protein